MARLVLVALLFALTVAGAGTADAGGGNVFVVNVASNIGDDEITDEICDVDINTPALDCTFRAALMEANDEPGMDTIEWADGMIQAFVSQTPLPHITDPVSIDGGTADCGASACIRIPGTNSVDVGPNGIVVDPGGSGSSIHGLVLVDWTGAAVIISEDTTNVVVAGNYIGTDATGLVAQSNNNGVVVAGSFNTIGGSGPEDRNVISGNSNYGLALWGTDVTGNVVENNYIGVGADGATPLGNSEGIHFNTNAFLGRVAGSGGGGGGNLIGPDNVISNNQNEGICLCDADGNTVSGNYIGVDATGNNAAPNDVGIFTFGSNNFIGGPTAFERNVISGNDEYGIDVSGSTGGGIDNQIIGNYIGTNAAGTSAIGNGKSGVFLGATTGTRVGGDTEDHGNVISGNVESGVVVYDSDLTTIANNYIGTSASGEQGLGNGMHGISVVQNSANGSIDSNVIADNGNIGLMLDQGATGFLIERNRIGVTPSGDALGNANHGVLARDSIINRIGSVGFGNIIANNGGDGVRVSVDNGISSVNTISGNSIFSNDLMGIDNVNGGNTELPPPVISGGLRAGQEISGTACPSCQIEIFSDDVDEGRVYEGSTFSESNGTWVFNEPVEGPFITATATSGENHTSEFSAPVKAPEPPTPTPTPEPTATPVPTPSDTPEPTSTPQPSETPGPTPTGTPSGKAIQGDTDCDQDADSVDALFVLREVAGFPKSECIELGGDVDCDEDRDSVDALGILRYVAALPPLVQQEPCADIGTPT